MVYYTTLIYMVLFNNRTNSIGYKDYSPCCCWLKCLQDPIFLFLIKTGKLGEVV